jgi:hypothetical protein
VRKLETASPMDVGTPVRVTKGSENNLPPPLSCCRGRSAHGARRLLLRVRPGESLAPTIHFEAAAHANYTVAHRPSSAIRMVVIHVTESSALSAISWFRNPRAEASANYVVSGTGAITQMVPDSDIAWQAGNWAITASRSGRLRPTAASQSRV